MQGFPYIISYTFSFMLLTWINVVIWQGFNKYITVRDANLKPISIPHNKASKITSNLFPPLSLLTYESSFGMFNLGYVLALKVKNIIKTVNSQSFLKSNFNKKNSVSIIYKVTALN